MENPIPLNEEQAQQEEISTPGVYYTLVDRKIKQIRIKKAVFNVEYALAAYSETLGSKGATFSLKAMSNNPVFDDVLKELGIYSTRAALIADL